MAIEGGTNARKPRVVILGAGFAGLAGLQAAVHLAGKPVEVVMLIDWRNVISERNMARSKLSRSGGNAAIVSFRSSRDRTPSGANYLALFSVLWMNAATLPCRRCSEASRTYTMWPDS